MSARTKMLFAAALLAGFITACDAKNASTNETPMKLHLTATSFTDGQPIPRRHAFDDLDRSPELQWPGAPPGTKSLALICDDPDAPMGTWVHWVIYDLPPATLGLSEGIPQSPELANGAKQGVNYYKHIGYGSPCPPSGKSHRYFFKLYALDIKPELKSGLTKRDLLKAMEGHVLADGQLMGTYQRK